MVKAVQVAFNFSDEWEGFIKTAIFSNGSTTTDVPLDKEDKCYIPHEVLAVPGEEVTVGVYGCKGEGDDYVAIPTEKQSLGEVIEGVDPLGEEPKEPTPTVWDELKIKVENMYSKEEINELLAQKDPTHEIAGVYKTDISLLDLESETDKDNVVINEKSVDLGETGTAKFYVSGHIRFITQGVWGIHLPTIKVDGKIIDSKVIGTDEDEYMLYAHEFDGDVAESIELIASGSFTIVNFETLCEVEEVDGFMSAEQAEKLENTPTTEEVNNLITEAFGTVEAVFDDVHEYAESLGGDEA
jgi:hypothetical protein